MPFLTGHTVQSPNANAGTTNLQNELVGYLGGKGGNGLERLFPGTKINPEDIQPYLDMFTVQNTRNLAQAKESAGNLTGSGFANTLGARTAEANSQQGAFLANLFETRRNEDANRMASVLMGALNSNAGGVSTSYQPGLLDYAAQGITGLAGGGAFNGLFGGGGGAAAGAAGGSFDPMKIY